MYYVWNKMLLRFKQIIGALQTNVYYVWNKIFERVLFEKTV